MPSNIKIYKIGDFIRKTASGTIDRDRSVAIVHELSIAANYHADHNIMLDFRETDLKADTGDLIDIALEFARHKAIFKNKIAVTIPDTEERRELARQFKACMDLQGFEYQYFMDFEAAIEWLAVVS